MSSRPKTRAWKSAKSSSEHFTKLVRHTMEEPAWRALSTTAQALYPWLKLEWKGKHANNNGQIRLSIRQAADRIGVDKGTAARAFHELQAKGFIVMTAGAELGTTGAATSPSWEITEIVMAMSNKPEGRKLYREWQPGADFPTQKSSPNNPRGRNGRKKPCPKFADTGVRKTRTETQTLSAK